MGFRKHNKARNNLDTFADMPRVLKEFEFLKLSIHLLDYSTRSVSLDSNLYRSWIASLHTFDHVTPLFIQNKATL
jgi:hypothetical protein